MPLDYESFGMIPSKFCPDDEDGRLFCFTPIKFRKVPHCRDRSTPDGHWKATDTTRMIKDKEGNPVGYVQTLSYYHGKNGGARSKWIMKEYTLHANSPQNVALCVIYSSLRYKKSNKERDSCLKPIQNQSSFSYNASSKDDVSNFGSSQGSPSIHGISISYSSGVGACSGSVNIDDGMGGAGLIGDHLLPGSSWQGPFSGDNLLSAAELPCLPDNGCPDGGDIDIFKVKDAAGSSNLPGLFLEEVDSPVFNPELWYY
ncbi:NAC domain-containing protein [Dioscorea alata]|uniref:NAC domain-containing protein n=2 Tax=Dioscorea alata TaxID=55571 RepID=A0ACB7WR57_DIOAL|nr:NAC domain-containing protein [Dioscorea alata]KAH7690734.1 NAC domain-containing protein [Dioscorea alata]